MIFALLVAGAYALATLRRYSVAQTATLTTFALFLSSGLTTVSGAPIFDDHAEMRDEPWINSCGTTVTASPKHNQHRHSVYRTMKRVKTQLRTAQNHFRTELKDVQEIYSNVTEQLKEQYSLPWLPEKQFEWYHKELWCLDKAKKAEIALPKLHDTLQRFAITFHHLQYFSLESHLNTDTREKRKRIINGMYHEILRMLCEVETAILTLGIEMPPTLNGRIVTDSPNWTKGNDFTQMLIQDSGILRLYQIFLNDWAKALRNATVTGPGTCDPTKLKPFAPKRKKGKKNQGKNKNKNKNKNAGQDQVGVRKQGQSKRIPSTGGKKISQVGTGQAKRGPRRNKLNRNKQTKTQ